MRLSDLGVRFPWAVLGLSGVVTVLSLFAGAKLTLQSDITSLLPRSIESVQALDQLKDNFGGLGHLVMAIESGSPTKML